MFAEQLLVAFNPKILRQTNDGYELIKVQSITNSTPKDKFKPCPKACSARASACMACRTLVIEDIDLENPSFQATGKTVKNLGNCCQRPVVKMLQSNLQLSASI